MNRFSSPAARFVIGIGLVSLFADFTYEGGRSIIGPYLALLGAGPILAGTVAGVGEFLGYAIRFFSGRFADRTRRHWAIMGTGYTINLLAVPALALAGSAAVAAGLVCAERLGKGLRNPARDALLSRAGSELGHGRAFAWHEFLDQLGALIGPLMVAGITAAAGYRLGFAALLGPALVALVFLYRARGLEPAAKQDTQASANAKPSGAYYRYLAFSVVTVAGFAHFILVSYHLELTHRLEPALIPVLYALAMGTDALAALATGHLFDRYGMRVLYALPVLTLPATPLLFLTNQAWIWVGAVLWGAALGVQESTMRAAVATLAPEHIRASAYGTFDTAFGVAWMVGSIVMGALYGLQPVYLVGFAMFLQVAALPLLARVPMTS
jgi:MFS family permease